jgi:hypothetical protein
VTRRSFALRIPVPDSANNRAPTLKAVVFDLDGVIYRG